MARPLRPYPPPLELSGHTFFSRFFLELQKTVFFLSGQALTPPSLLVAGPLKKNVFVAFLSSLCYNRQQTKTIARILTAHFFKILLFNGRFTIKKNMHDNKQTKPEELNCSGHIYFEVVILTVVDEGLVL